MTYDIIYTRAVCDLSDHDADTPYLECRFGFEFTARRVVDAGRSVVEVDYVQIQVIEARTVFAEGATPWKPFIDGESMAVAWLRRQMDKSETLREKINAMCVNEFERDPSWANVA